MTAPVVTPLLARSTVSEGLADWLVAVGVRWVFGVSGGGVAPLWGSLSRASGLQVVHCQHEAGAAFCAMEASLATGAPVAVFTTTGPGLTNALTGLIAARDEGARVLAFSGVTPTGRRHRQAAQECGPSSALAALYGAGSPFDLAATVDDAASLSALLQHVEDGLAREGGFVAHLGLPTDLQAAPSALRRVPVRVSPARPDPEALDALAERLAGRRCAMVVGFGARGCADDVRAVAEALDAPVVVTPRGKGAFPERHPLALGVLGFAGHERAMAALDRNRPEVVLAIGTDLGEGSSQYTAAFEGAELVLVGARAVGATACRSVERVHGAPADVMRGLRARLPEVTTRPLGRARSARTPDAEGPVSPLALMDAVQRQCVDTGLVVMAEPGNAFAFAIHHLQFDRPRFRVSVAWGSMGTFTCGVVGAALATGLRHVALVGDGAMQMQHELLTAVHHRADATWVVLNDSGYGMCRQGTSLTGIEGVDCELPEVDFAAWARSMGAWARTVRDAGELEAALKEAVDGRGPRLLDVRIDRSVAAPISGRVRQLTWSGDAPAVTR